MKKILLSISTVALLLVPSMASAKHHTATPATTTATTTPAATTTSATTPGKIVHVNSATAAELTTVPGINAKIAADVIRNRPYKTADELVKKVKGIGPKNVKKMLPFIDFQ